MKNIDDVHELCSEFDFSKKPTTNLGFLTVFQRKSDNVYWTHQIRHTFSDEKLTMFFAKVRLSNNKDTIRIIDHSTTTCDDPDPN